MRTSVTAIGAIALASIAAQAHAGWSIYTTQAAFNTALTTAGYSFMGSTAWNAAGPNQLFNDPLSPGVANGPFPTGTPLGMGMTVQSNTLGNAPSTLSPRGLNGLTWFPAGSAGVSGNLQPSDQLSPNSPGDSFDMIFTTVGGTTPQMVDMTPMFYRILGTGNTATINIRLYDAGSAFIGTETVSNVADCLENSYRGFQVWGGTTLGRINVAVNVVGGVGQDTASADNIRLYGQPVPEPASVVAIGLGTFALLRRRLRS